MNIYVKLKLMNNYFTRNIDVQLIILFFALTIFGLINLYSVDYKNLLVFEKQLKFSIAAVISFTIIIIINWRIIYSFTEFGYIVSILLLILVLIIGDVVNGSKSWLGIGKYGIQPSEFVKITTCLFLAKYMVNNKKNNLQNKFHIAGIIIFPVILIMLQPDLGSVLTFASFLIVFVRFKLFEKIIYNSFIIIAGAISLIFINKIYIIIIMFLILLIKLRSIKKRKLKNILKSILYFSFIFIAINGSESVYENALNDYQKKRINVILGLEKDPLGVGYNLAQSKIAIGSGGFSGKGFLKGTQTKFNFIPEQQTDFIFCAVGEEWGFLGSLVLIITYITLIMRILFLSEKNNNNIIKIYGYGIASFLFIHVILNIGMTIGLFPTIGIPLPFLSAGGSSMISFSIMIGVFVNLCARVNYY